MAFSWFWGHCKISLTHSEEPLILPTKTGGQREFPQLCRDVTPPCYLNPFLFNGHLQTAWTARAYDGPPVHYRRRVFESTDDNFAGHFAVDFVVPAPALASEDKDEEGNFMDDVGLKEDPVGVGHTVLPPRTTYFTDGDFASLASDDTKPLLILLHGLSGGSYENYLRHVVAHLIESTSEGGRTGISGADWEVMVLNSRGCAGSKITSSILYNARSTWDLRQMVKWCRKTWPNRPLFGVGFSLGANILTNYLGEEGSDCVLSAACVVANPWNLEVSSLNVQRTMFGREVYSKTMGGSMKRLFDTHEAQVTQNRSLQPERIHKVKYLFEFDREVQCATWGYPTEGAYYRDASSSDSVVAIRIPVMALHAMDDPIACEQAVPYDEIRQSPYVVLVASDGGGHLGWFEFNGERWHARPIVNFLNAMAREVDFKAIKPPELHAKGPHGGHRTPFMFEPMRRKAHFPGSAQ